MCSNDSNTMTEPAETSSAPKPAAKITAWLQLLRLPNLFTVPGDPVAGFVLASGSSLGCNTLPHAIPAIVVSLLLYCFGLIVNDLIGIAEDRRNRASRPLASGHIPPRQAALAAVALFAAAMTVAYSTSMLTGALATMLAIVILAYNALRHWKMPLPELLMGSCRAISVMLGATVAPSVSGRRDYTIALTVACCVGIYIAFVTGFARNETETSKLPVLKRLSPPQRQKLVGTLIRILLIYQAAAVLIAWPSGWIIAAALLICWPISSILGKRFYAS